MDMDLQTEHRATDSGLEDNRKIVIDLMSYTNRPDLRKNLEAMVKDHHGSYRQWLHIGPIPDTIDGANVLAGIASQHITPGDFVIVLFEVPAVYDRKYDQFVFRSFAGWGPITVYTEPTTVV